MITLTEREIQHNLRAVAHAIAQQELEGLEVPQPTVDDLRRAARGEIDTEEVIRNICRRFNHVATGPRGRLLPGLGKRKTAGHAASFR
jgi:hypothetical protein